MSEYQYYEFHAIDQPLDSEELESVGKMSSRVRLTPRKAIFTYSYSDFRYDEEAVLVDYFDFMLYLANWGSKRMMMKFPAELVDYDFLKKYEMSVEADYEQDVRILKRSGFVLVDVKYSEEDGSGWIEEDYGYDFLNIRNEIMNRDYRSLFIIWLRFLEDFYKSYEFDPDYSFDSRLIPSNLGQLSASGYAVKEFYRVNQDWLDVMRSYSGKSVQKTVDWEAQILKMSPNSMATYLKMILRDEPNLKARLMKELKDEGADNKNDEVSWIRLQEIGDKVKGVAEARKEKEQKEKAHQEQERMNKMQKNQDRIKQEIRENIERGDRKYYKMAISEILELKAMNDYFDTLEYFEIFLDQIVSDYSRKSSFIRMLREKKLIEK